VSHKNDTNVVRYFLVQLSSLINPMSMVSGVSVQVSGDMKIQRTVTKGGLFLFPVICYLTPETRHLTPDT